MNHIIFKFINNNCKRYSGYLWRKITSSNNRFHTASTMDNKDSNISWKESINKKGEYVRKTSHFRNFVTADGSSGFKAEANRYHLYVSLACPWAHRTLIMRELKGLSGVISYTVVDWLLDERSWRFSDKVSKCSLDTLNNCSNMRELYQLIDKDFRGPFTVPVLWDKEKKTIVSSESSEIIQMLNTEFNAFGATPEQAKLDLSPQHLQEKINQVNEWIYPQVNNGVYRSGFATSQEAYDEAVHQVFDGLDKLEAILSTNRYLCGDELTLADIRLFTTLVRFDKVYVGHFKCNKKRIVDYPNIWGYTREIYQLPGVKDTVDFDHIVQHYHRSHVSINPHGIVPIGPDVDFDEPHGRNHLPKSSQSP